MGMMTITMIMTMYLPSIFIASIVCLTLLCQPIAAAQDPRRIDKPIDFQSSIKWSKIPPTLKSFASYEDMNKYIADRVNRGLYHLDNPNHDTYIKAFNEYNERSQNQAEIQLQSSRAKRQTELKKLPNEPRMLRFDISDAVEPNEETKKLIQKHRNRELEEVHEQTTSIPDQKNVTTRNIMRLSNVNDTVKRAKVSRSRRHTPGHKFQVQLIPFEASDAREPDEETKQLIKRMRALEVKKFEQSKGRENSRTVMQTSLPTSQNAPSTEIVFVASLVTSTESSVPPSVSPTLPQPLVRYSKARKMIIKSSRKRTRRELPEMIKFELEDAKEPDESLKALINFSRESKELSQIPRVQGLKDQKMQVVGSDNVAKSTRKSDDDDVTKVDDEAVEDQNSEESRKFFFSESEPIKVKKSVNSLPHEVQKVISHYVKGGNGAKAYVRHLPSQQMDYNQLRSQQSSNINEAVKNSYAQLVPPPQPPTESQSQHIQIQMQSVPVVENVRYFYTTGVAAVPQLQTQSLIGQPIVVSDAANIKQISPQLAQVHHTYTADLNLAQQHGEEIGAPQQIVTQQQIVAANPPEAKTTTNTEEQPAAIQTYTSVPVENYKYEFFSGPAQGYNVQYENGKQTSTAINTVPANPPVTPVSSVSSASTETPLIKIEYLASDDAIKGDYKQLSEFKELSALMGVSMDDKIHGLSYLIAKEMQSKLKQKRQQKILLDQQQIQQQQQQQQQQEQQQQHLENTSPLLFHPPGYDITEAKAPLADVSNFNQINLLNQQGRLIGMGKSKQYIPIVEQPDSEAVANRVEAYDKLQQQQQEQQLAYEDAFKPQMTAPVQQNPKIPPPTSFLQYGLTHNYRRRAQPMPSLAAQAPEPKPAPAPAPASESAPGALQAVYGMKSLGGSAAQGYNQVLLGGYGGGNYIQGYQGKLGNKYGSSEVICDTGADGSAKGGAAIGAAGGAAGIGEEAGINQQLGAQVAEGKLGNVLNFPTVIDERKSLQYASKYAFGYRIRDFNSGNDFGHKQNRDLDGITRGQYHILLPDGRVQNVIYHADNTGFHADVSFESGH